MSVRFHLPNFVDRFNGSMNMTLISMIKRMPRMFYDGVEIASVFDCFPMIWNDASWQDIWICKPWISLSPSISADSILWECPAA